MGPDAADSGPAKRSRPHVQRGAALDQQVRDALTHLHDLPYLQTHPLARLLELDPATRAPTPGHVLQERLLGAIQRLRPSPDTPPGARAWRTYRLLHLRYVEGLEVVEAIE